MYLLIYRLVKFKLFLLPLFSYSVYVSRAVRGAIITLNPVVIISLWGQFGCQARESSTSIDSAKCFVISSSDFHHFFLLHFLVELSTLLHVVSRYYHSA